MSVRLKVEQLSVIHFSHIFIVHSGNTDSESIFTTSSGLSDNTPE